MTVSQRHCPIDDYNFWNFRIETNPYMIGRQQLREKFLRLLENNRHILTNSRVQKFVAQAAETRRMSAFA